MLALYHLGNKQARPTASVEDDICLLDPEKVKESVAKYGRVLLDARELMDEIIPIRDQIVLLHNNKFENEFSKLVQRMGARNEKWLAKNSLYSLARHFEDHAQR